MNDNLLHVAENKRVIIGVDCMGSDNAPYVEIKAILAMQHLPVDFVLFGDRWKIQQELGDCADKFFIVHTEHYVKQSDIPSEIVRNSQTSLFLALSACKNKEVDAVVSAGNTGAYVLLANKICGLIESFSKICLAVFIPCIKNKKLTKKLIVDVGANLSCSSQNLLEFAVLGQAAYESWVLRNDKSNNGNSDDNSRIGLLNIGVENHKGSMDVQNTHLLLRNKMNDQYIGFVEGNDIASDKCEIIVTEGVIGNVALKVAEGTLKIIKNHWAYSMKQNQFFKIFSYFMFKIFKKSMDLIHLKSDEGGLLLGCNELMVKSHGGASVSSFCSTLQYTCELLQQSFVTKMLSAIKNKKNLL